MPPSARREEAAVMGAANQGRYFQPPWQVLITRVTHKGGWVQPGVWGTGAGALRAYSKLRERGGSFTASSGTKCWGSAQTLQNPAKFCMNRAKSEASGRENARVLAPGGAAFGTSCPPGPTPWGSCWPWVWGQIPGSPTPQLLPARPRAPRRHRPGWRGVPGVAGT